MMFTRIAAVLLAAVPAALAQGPIGTPQLLVGTWSSGSQAVQTGWGFAYPANQSFKYPKTAGISYSFTTDGFYEISRYRFNGNGSHPTCITGTMNWVHGQYVLNSNGSMTLTPFGDGYQQIQDQCAAVSNFIENYNITELVAKWEMFQDPTTGYKLHLYQFDGSPLPPMFQVSQSPNMLPTRMLRNVTAPVTTQDGLTKSGNLRKRSAGEHSLARAGGLATGLFAVAAAVALL